MSVSGAGRPPGLVLKPNSKGNSMKPIPMRKVRRLVRDLAEMAEDAQAVGFRFEIDGVYGVDKSGEVGLAAALEDDLPSQVPVDADLSATLKKSWQSLGAGSWRLTIWHDPPPEAIAEGRPVALTGVVETD